MTRPLTCLRPFSPWFIAILVCLFFLVTAVAEAQTGTLETSASLRPPAQEDKTKLAAPWTPEEYFRAAQACLFFDGQLGMTYEPLPPIKEGACGAPAPLRLSAFGGRESVRVRPAAVMRCALAEALHTWFVTAVQPAAESLMGTRVTGLINVSAYVCRNRYGRSDTRISEHAYANAIDIAGFQLADGGKVTILADWDGEDPRRQEFLRRIHAAACGIFGTVLGPLANAAHKDHFHLDLAERRGKAFCE